MAGLEERLFGAADKLRGHIDAAAYKHVVLALLFLRFVASGRGRLRCPREARWTRLAPGRIDAALAAVERANPALAGALPRGLDGLARVDELLALLSDVRFADGRDDLGRVYESFLDRFARGEGRRGGQFYTPRSVVHLLRALLAPLAGRVYDPCCGSGGMFVHGGTADEAFGQESNPGTWRLARQNLALHGIEADLGPRAADTFHDDLHAGRQADVVLANPPFNQSDWGAERLRDDPRWRFGPPPPGNANFAWLQVILAHLAPEGRAGVVLANGSLGVAKAGQGAIRRAIVESGWMDAVVALPPQLFLSTPIPACIWVLARERPDRTLFLDARGLGTLVDRARRALTEVDINRLASAYHAYRDGARVDEPGLAATVDRTAIARRGFVLFPGRYVTPAVAPEVEPPRARLRRLKAEWETLAEESERLAREIREMGLGV